MNVVGKLKGETFCESDAVLGTNIQHSGPPTYRGVREKFSRLLSVNISLVDVLTYMDPNVEVEGDVEINSGPASPHNQILTPTSTFALLRPSLPSITSLNSYKTLYFYTPLHS